MYNTTNKDIQVKDKDDNKEKNKEKNNKNIKLISENIAHKLSDNYLNHINDPNLSADIPNKQIMVMATGIAVQIILSEIPGVDILLAATMITDMIDPYNYNNTLTRSGIDSIANNIINKITTALKEQLPTLVIQVYNELKDAYPAVTIEQVTAMLNNATNFWTLVDEPQVQPDCYGDYDTKKKLAGSPKDGCNTLYKGYYEQYYATNKENYLNGNYKAISNLFTNIISTNVTTFRNNTFKVIFIISFIGILILIIILFLIKWQRHEH